MKLNAILLRAPDPSHADKYESAFNAPDSKSRGVCVPVLETVLVNAEELRRVVSGEPKVDGVIMTSARSCEAWKEAFEQSEGPDMKLWSEIPFYVVGEATAASLRKIYPNPGQIRGEETGTAEQLARFILEDLQGASSKCLLYLTGDKNRDTLPKIMKEGHVQLEPIQVYETRGSSNFPVDLEEALKGFGKDGEFWITFFAPSAAEFVYPHLQTFFCFQSIDPEPSCPSDSLPLARIAAIGPTTASFLHDTLHLHVDVVPAKPNSSALVEAIRAQSHHL